jgi:hypothetical protein
MQCARCNPITKYVGLRIRSQRTCQKSSHCRSHIKSTYSQWYDTDHGDSCKSMLQALTGLESTVIRSGMQHMVIICTLKVSNEKLWVLLLCGILTMFASECSANHREPTDVVKARTTAMSNTASATNAPTHEVTCDVTEMPTTIDGLLRVWSFWSRVCGDVTMDGCMLCRSRYLPVSALTLFLSCLWFYWRTNEVSMKGAGSSTRFYTTPVAAQAIPIAIPVSEDEVLLEQTGTPSDMQPMLVGEMSFPVVEACKVSRHPC